MNFTFIICICSHFLVPDLFTELHTRQVQRLALRKICEFRLSKYWSDGMTHSIFKFKLSFINNNAVAWKYLAISMISVATAMLCKEQGITITAVCTVYEIFIIQKVSAIPSLIYDSNRLMYTEDSFTKLLY